MRFVVGLTLLLCAAGTSVAQTAQPPIKWLERPDAAAMSRVYPTGAGQDDLNGLAVLSCRIGRDGRLEACEVVREEPSDEQFGTAALALAWSFRAEVPKSGGDPVGRRIELPFRFQMPEPAPPTEADAREMRDAARLASRILLTWFGVLALLWAAATAVLVVWPMRTVLKAAGVRPSWAYLYLVPGFGLLAPWLVAGRVASRRNESER